MYNLKEEISNGNYFIHLCDECIQAIESRGEKLIKGDTLYFDDNNGHCDWCEETDFDTLVECKWR